MDISKQPARVAAALLFVLFFGLAFLPAFLSADSLLSTDSPSASAPERLWALDARYLRGLDPQSGTSQTHIPLRQADVITVDETGNVWSFGRGTLKAHDPDGRLILQRYYRETRFGPGLKLFVDTPRNTVWLVQPRGIHRFGLSGERLGRQWLRWGVIDADLDRDTGHLWSAGPYRLWSQNKAGERLSFSGFYFWERIHALSFDTQRKQLWLAAGRELRRYDADGKAVFRVPLRQAGRIEELIADGNGELWAAGRQRIAYFDGNGQTRFVLRPFHQGRFYRFFRSDIRALALNPADRSLWVAGSGLIHRYSIDGSLLQTFNNPSRRLRDLAFYQPDDQAPTLSILAPADGALLNSDQPDIRLSYQGRREADLATLAIRANEQNIAADCQTEDGEEGAINCALQQALPQGELTLAARIDDASGQSAEAEPITLRIDSLAPQITLELPSDNSLGKLSPIRVIGEVDEVADVQVNGQSAPLNEALRFDVEQPLVEGSNPITVQATDTAGNQSSVTRTVTLDTQAPVALVGETVVLEFAEDGQLRLTGAAGSAEPGSSITVTNLRSGQSVTVTVAADGSFVVLIAADAGDPLSLSSTDSAGNRSDALELATPDDGLPPAPQTVAPELSTTQMTPMAEATAFLYSGPNPIQTGVAEGTIEARRAAVIRGKVMDTDGNALSGVTVTIKDRPQLGQTLSRRDGRFDLAVNGGGRLTLNYQKDGFLPLQRQVDAPWQDYASAEDVVLIALDPQVTTVDLANAVTPQIAQGTMQSDADGQRQATLMFPPGTTATMTLPSGQKLPLSTLNVRATEYTVGDMGPQRMPGELPANSGYTYAVELSVDEAIAAGAEQVTFSQPIPLYVDNFLNFPVGEPVPLGYYDRKQAAWIPSDNGRIIAILSEDNGTAVLDVDGEGNPASAERLNELGIDTAELQQLAALYEPGKSLWRSPIPHFTPWDCNWPFGPPNDAIPPPTQSPGTPSDKDPDSEDRDECDGCMIEPQGQVLGEEIPIVGTPYKLVYRSDRTQGYKSDRQISVPLSGASVPASLEAIELKISIAGQVFEQTFPAEPNQTFTYTWDGKDAYGREVVGTQTAGIDVSYRYQILYYSSPTLVARSFAQASGSSGGEGVGGARIIGQRRNQTIRSNRHWEVSVASQLVSAESSIGRWTVDAHHQYDISRSELFKGDGTRRSAKSISNSIETVINGNPDNRPPASVFGKFSGLAVSRDGKVYLANYIFPGTISQYDPIENKRSRLAGGAFERGREFLFKNDGFRPLDMRLSLPQDIVVAPDDSIYIIDNGRSRSTSFDFVTEYGEFKDPNKNIARIRRIRLDGFSSTIAGRGDFDYQDGLPAWDVKISPRKLAVDKDGNVYFTAGNRIHKIGLDGIVETIAGQEEAGFSGDGGPATSALLDTPHALVFDRNGNLYVTERKVGRIRRIDPQGVITTIAGTGKPGFSGDGGLATQAQLGGNLEGKPAFDSQGNIYIPDDANNRIRKISVQGVITTFAGTGEFGFRQKSGVALQSSLIGPNDLAIDQEDNLYIADYMSPRIHRIAINKILRNTETISVASKDGRWIYTFSSTGQHQRTLDAYTGVTKHAFEYDDNGRLIGIRDVDKRLTQIAYAGDNPVSITGPDGQQTLLTIDSRGYLTAVENPAAERYAMQYDDNGLLLSYTDRRGLENRFDYNDLGLLVRDINAGGGGWQLNKTLKDDGYVTNMTTAEGRRLSFSVEPQSDGGRRQIDTRIDGTQDIREFTAAGEEITRSANGTVTTLREAADPRFGSDAPLIDQLTVQTPSGLTATTSYQRSLSLSNPDDPLSFTSILESSQINGKTTLSEYEAAERRYRGTSPQGRSDQMQVNLQNRPIFSQISGLNPLRYTYNSEGRLTDLIAGDGDNSRSTQLSYYTAEDGIQSGYLKSITDALGRTTTFQYDGAGRVIGQTLPDGRQVGFTYDANGNLSSLQPPGRPTHRFDYNNFDLEDDYTPPQLEGIAEPNTRYRYNLDQELTQILRPDGQSIDYQYNNLGQLVSKTLPRGDYQYRYSDTSGQLTGITAPGGNQLAMQYDAFLMSGWSWSGDISGNVQRSHDNDFRVSAHSVNGETPIQHRYDRDDLLTQAGDLNLTRADQRGGLITATTLGGITTNHSYNGFAEPTAMQAMQGTQSLYSTDYQRDKLGRITQKTETLLGETFTERYSYDLTGRLTEVNRNGEITTYAYDSNSNRLSRSDNGTTTETAEYDAQDRLTRYASDTYQYNANGELTEKSNGSETTQYRYDVLSNLLGVTLADGTNIDYIIDAMDRRIGKRRNGQLEQGWLYKDQLNPIAELNPDGTVKSRFVYADKGHVPAYMIKDGVTYRILSDHLGSPRLVVNADTGEVAQQLEYDTFGRVISDSNPKFQPFGFAGGLYDPDTGLVRFGARDYDPQAGRWTSKDPIRFAGRDANLYGYVLADPVNLIDKDGRLVINLFSGFVNAAISAGAVAIQGGDAGDIAAAAALGFVTGFLPPGISNAVVNAVGNITQQVTNPCFNGSIDLGQLAAGTLIGGTGANVKFADSFVSKFAPGSNPKANGPVVASNIISSGFSLGAGYATSTSGN